MPRCLSLAFVAFAFLATFAVAAEPEFKPIFDGKSLDGWLPEGGGTWKVVDGAIVGTNAKTEAKHGHLFYKSPVKNFSVRVKFKSVSGNSGLYFRTEKVAGNVGIKGFQAEIDPANDVGGLYETHGRSWVVKPTAEEVQKFFKPGDWNSMTVTAVDRHITVTVNGIATAELKNDPGRTEGWLAFQVHGGQNLDVQLKEIELAVLP